MGAFEQLAVYRRAADLSDSVHGLVASWPSFEMWTIGIQLVRAVDSIGANIAEGYGRGSDADQRRLLIVARGSVHEAEHWFMRARARDRLKDPGLEREVREVGRMLNGLLRTFRTP